MPPDPLQRRRRQPAEEDADTEFRRSRGEISCAECRRLKLRCDKQLPCSTCVRRGCSSLCPNGIMSAGQGAKSVLADTEQLYRKTALMAQRIRQLEDALAIFQAGVSNECHPLLQDELLAIKYGDSKQETPETDVVDGTADFLGTLTVGGRGEEKYFGRSGGSETLFLVGAGASEREVEDNLPPIIVQLSRAFPFGLPIASEESLDIVYSFLPPQPRAWTLCETYFEHVTFIANPARRDDIIDDILTPLYKWLKLQEGKSTSRPRPVSPHQLAVLYAVFALGTLTDLTLPPLHPDADLYFYLCKAALACHPVLESPEIPTVQALTLLGLYLNFRGTSSTMDDAWFLLSLANRIGLSLGLHRDSARWHMDPKTVDRRRSLFWECCMSDMFMSLSLGRPPSFLLRYVDCEFPADPEQVLDSTGKPQVGFFRWKHEFAKDILSQVVEQTLSAQGGVTYQTILELDRKVREKLIPPHLDAPYTEDESVSPAQYLRRHIFFQLRTVVLMHIHRSFFARALLDHPANPLRSPYSPSVLCAHRCASLVIKNTVRFVNRLPDLCARWNVLWTHVFAAALIAGSLVTRAPASTMAPSAFMDFKIAIDLFEKASSSSCRARRSLILLDQLRGKAFSIYEQCRSGKPQPNYGLSTYEDEGEIELALFGGQTSVFATSLLAKKRAAATRERAGDSQALYSESPDSHHSSPSSATDSSLDVHPSLVEYVSYLPHTPSTQPPATPAPLPLHSAPAAVDPSYQYLLPAHDIHQPVASYEHFPDMYNLHAQPDLQHQSLFPVSGTPGATRGYDAITRDSPMPSPGDFMNISAPQQPFTDMKPPSFVMDEQWISFMSGLFNKDGT